MPEEQKQREEELKAWADNIKRATLCSMVTTSEAIENLKVAREFSFLPSPTEQERG
jgi:hypothetical protein